MAILKTIRQKVARHLLLLLADLFTYPFSSTGFATRVRGFILKPIFKRCGKRLKIGRNVVINTPESIYLGDNVYIAHNCYINGIGGLSIGSFTMIGPSVIISTSKHSITNSDPKAFTTSFVEIGEYSWIGGNSSIVGAAKIGSHCVVGAGTVVCKPFPSGSKILGGYGVSK